MTIRCTIRGALLSIGVLLFFVAMIAMAWPTIDSSKRTVAIRTKMFELYDAALQYKMKNNFVSEWSDPHAAGQTFEKLNWTVPDLGVTFSIKNIVIDVKIIVRGDLDDDGEPETIYTDNGITVYNNW